MQNAVATSRKKQQQQQQSSVIISTKLAAAAVKLAAKSVATSRCRSSKMAAKSLVSISVIMISIATLARAASYLQQQQHNQQQLYATTTTTTTTTAQLGGDLAAQSGQAPVIAPFTFINNVTENQRVSVICTISSGDLPVSISWLKDGQVLSAQVAQARKIVIKTDSDSTSSTLKFASVRLEHSGNYTCVARNRAGVHSHTAPLIVLGEPRWLRAPQHEPIVATRGQTVVIECQTTGWPRPQQSWLIKTHRHAEFEPLFNTSRVWLLPNGSLVILNADKSDEANYLCKSVNGIGKGIGLATSLKVTVPAHFESDRAQNAAVRRQSAVQLRCDAYGDEPITIEWYKNNTRVSSELDSRYSIHNKPLANGLISLLVIKQTQRLDNALYECYTRNQVGSDTHKIELLVQEEPDNIQELQVTQINSRSVSLMWNKPYDGRNSITSYMLQYRRVQHDHSPVAASDSAAVVVGAADEISDYAAAAAAEQVPPVAVASDDWQQALRVTVPANQLNSSNVVAYTIERLEPSTKYVLRALAINAIGESKFSQPMEFQTQEEPPELAPGNVRALPLNSTSVLVSWDEIPRNKQPGRIHGYYIGYRLLSNAHHSSNSSSSNQQHQHQQQQQQQQQLNSFVYKPYIISDSGVSAISDGQVSEQRLEFVLNELRRDTAYEITVMAFNSRGSGPSSELATCRTVEMEAPRAVKLHIRRESNESIFIEWHRDPTDQNPVDDYILYQEKNSASQDWVQVRLPGNQTQYKAPGLKCGTRYQFYIIAHNKVGKSPPSEVVGASTSGALPAIPSKTSLIKKINSTCLLINLNSFQDNACRIRAFTLRYRAERSVAANGTTLSLVGSNGLAAAHQALLSPSSPISSSSSSSSSSNNNNNNKQQPGNGGMLVAANNAAAAATVQPAAEWKTVTLKSNAKYQRANEEDRMEYLCDLNPAGEYTIHVHATNDVGRSEIEYTVLMSSDELRHSHLRDLAEYLANLPNLFAYVPSMLVFLLAGLCLSLTSLVLYTTAIKYYQKFVIMHNQVRATRRAKRDERRRRKLNKNNKLNKLDLWSAECAGDEDDDDDQYDDGEEDGDDEGGDNDDCGGCHMRTDSSASSSSSSRGNRRAGLRAAQFATPARGHYLSGNVMHAAGQFDSSSLDSHCKFAGSCHSSTASTDSMRGGGGRFRCLNSKQYVKMNEYTMLPSISASLSPPTDIYGVASPNQSAVAAAAAAAAANQAANNSLYYSTLRRSNMQTYLPARQRQPATGGSVAQLQSQQQQQQQQHQHRTTNQQNMADIYGYYMAPPASNNATVVANTSQQQQEAANSIFVPPQQIIYSAPNIRRQPMFL